MGKTGLSVDCQPCRREKSNASFIIKISDKTIKSMSDVIENKPRRRRIVRGGDALMATSNETKMKEKTRVVEKKPAPLFKSEVVEKIKEIKEKTTEADEIIQFANPLPLSEKPRQTRGRKPKAVIAAESVSAEPVVTSAEPSAVSGPTPEAPKKRRGRPRKKPLPQEEAPVETVVEELMEKPQTPTLEERQLSLDYAWGEETPAGEQLLLDAEEVLSANVTAMPDTPSEEPAPKPKRGRPKKAKTEEPAPESEEQAEKPIGNQTEDSEEKPAERQDNQNQRFGNKGKKGMKKPKSEAVEYAANQEDRKSVV